jgi:hypothetical protein
VVEEQPRADGGLVGQAGQPVPGGAAVLADELDELASQLLVTSERDRVAAGREWHGPKDGRDRRGLFAAVGQVERGALSASARATMSPTRVSERCPVSTMDTSSRSRTSASSRIGSRHFVTGRLWTGAQRIAQFFELAGHDDVRLGVAARTPLRDVPELR